MNQERLSTDELATWRGFLRVHSELTQRLDAELRDAHDLPLTSYEVLLFLNDSPEGALRMSQLADGALLSRSGLTRLVDRLQARGLVARADSPEDGRGCLALITHEGRELFTAARRTHLAGVRRMFLAPLTADQRRVLAGAWDELLA